MNNMQIRDFSELVSNIHINNRTDLEGKDVHLSVSSGNFTIPKKSIQQDNSLVNRRHGLFFNMRRVGATNSKVSGPKISNLPKEMKQIRYIIITDKGKVINLYKHPELDDNIDPNKTQAEVDFLFLKNRFNTLPKNLKHFFTFLSKEFVKAEKAEKEMLSTIFSTLCDSPARTRNFFQIIGNLHCYSCFKLTKTKIKCIHFDCAGMCEKCFSDILDNDNCPACKRPQEVDCPICLERWSVRSCRIMSCGHGICYKCITRSWAEQEEDITQCPQCRAEN